MGSKLLSIAFLIVVLSGIIGLVLNMLDSGQFSNKQNKTGVRASIFPWSPDLDPTMVRSAGNYVVLKHLLRGLITMDSDGQIQGDLAVTWDISDNFKSFVFTMRTDARWSDGAPITAEQVCKSIEHQVALNRATHFDFSTIANIKCSSPYSIEINLKGANPSFLIQTSHPEFGVFRLNSNGSCDLTVTSGPYSPASITDQRIDLVKNPFHSSGLNSYPDRVSFSSGDVAEQLTGLIEGRYDFVIPYQAIPVALHERIIGSSELHSVSTNIGFTFWISINAKTLAHHDRLGLQSVLRPGTIEIESSGPAWTPADQLYLADGPGRPDKHKVHELWAMRSQETAAHFHGRSVRLLVGKAFPFAEQVIERLSQAGLQVQVTVYGSQAEFSDLVEKNEFDLVQVNNDFSSVDLLENLLVTFNSSRPLVFLGDGHRYLREAVEKTAVATTDAHERNEIFQRVGLELISQGLVVPIAYHKTMFYKKKNIDTSGWSLSFPEVAFWKAKILNR